MRERARVKGPLLRFLPPPAPRLPALVLAPLHSQAGLRLGAEGPVVASRSRHPHPPGLRAPSAPLHQLRCRGALLALKVGLEYFNRAIKRMLTYIRQEIHF